MDIIKQPSRLTTSADIFDPLSIINGINNYFADGLSGLDIVDATSGFSHGFSDFLSQWPPTYNSDGSVNFNLISGASGFTVKNFEQLEYTKNINGITTTLTLDLAIYVKTFSPDITSPTNVSVNAPIVLTFNESIQMGSGLIQLHTDSSTGPVVASSAVISGINNDTLTITPINTLSAGTHYFVTLDKDAVLSTAASNKHVFMGDGAAGVGVVPTYDFTTALAIAPVSVSVFLGSPLPGAIISDSSANIASNLDRLHTNLANITSITQTGTPAPLVITANQLTIDADVLAKIGTENYTLAISDTSSTIANSLDILQANIAKISSIHISDSIPLSINATIATNDAAALALITNGGGSVFNNTLDARGTNTVQKIVGGNASDLIYASNSASLLSGGNGNDTIIGGNGDDILLGGSGDNTLTGGLGSDFFSATSTDTITDLGIGGDDLYVAVDAITHVTLGGDFTATLATENNGFTQINTNGFNIDLTEGSQGTTGFNILNGSKSAKASTITASIDSDTIICGLSSDIITGNGGADSYIFNTENYKVSSNPLAYPTITDFKSGDKLKFQVPEPDESDSTAPALFDTFGQLKANDVGFYTSTDGSGLAIDPENRLIYNLTTGILTFDPDGNGQNSAIPIAKFSSQTILKATDIIILVDNEQTGTVTISGKAIQGQILTATNDLIDPNGMATPVTYQWFANATAISGATGSTLLLSEDLLDKNITVQSAYTDLLGTLENNMSFATDPVAGPNDPPSQDLVIAKGAENIGALNYNIPISFASLNAQVRAVDPVDTNNSFTIAALSSGSLKIGADASSATPWNKSNNYTIDATHKAFWTPDIYANGALTAFKAIGKDSHGDTSQIAIHAMVLVTPVNNIPYFNATPKAINYTENHFNDTFARSSGKLNASDHDAEQSISYGIKNGVVSPDGTTISQTNAFGTLTVQKSTGNYDFSPNATGFAALTKDTSTSFSMTVSDSIAPAVTTKLTISVQQEGLIGTDGNDTLNVISGNNFINGFGGNDILNGGRGNDVLNGGKGNDVINAGTGNETLIGGLGKDELTGNSSGKDTFKFYTTTESVPGKNHDSISNFTQSQDLIDLSSIDANTKIAGDQAFTFVGGHPFAGKAGELHYINGVLSADTNGDAKADFEVAITLVGTTTLTTADFVL